MSRGATKLVRSVMAQMGPRYFSNEPSMTLLTGATITFLHGNPAKAPENAVVTWMRFSMNGARNASTLALGGKHQEEDKQAQKGATSGATGGGNDNKAIVSYWGVEPPKVIKEDGTEWRWTCFSVMTQIFVGALCNYLKLWE